MAREKFGVAVSNDLVDDLDERVDECADLGTSRSVIVEAILIADFQSDVDHTARVRKLIIRRGTGNL